MISIGSDEMVDETIKLMKLVKAAIIYTVNSVSIEEKKKRQKFKGLISTMPVDTSQFL